MSTCPKRKKSQEGGDAEFTADGNGKEISRKTEIGQEYKAGFSRVTELLG